MRGWFLSVAVATGVALLVVLVDASPAWAGDPDGQNAYAVAQASGGQLTVKAGVTQWVPPADSSWATDQPDPCTYASGGALALALLGKGGPEPGQWVVPTCTGPGGIEAKAPVWVTDAQPVTATPVALAEHAVKKLGLSSPTIEMAPPSGDAQLVNTATWMWISPGAWKTMTASATAGPVTTTATATPEKVVWDMGNGASVTCDGPGTPYNANDPNATTDCSYTWPDPGTFRVTATIYWTVTWTATGAPGGGDLGAHAGPAAGVTVHVEESQAINTPRGGD